jgi:hypothetical protein
LAAWLVAAVRCLAFVWALVARLPGHLRRVAAGRVLFGQCCGRSAWPAGWCLLVTRCSASWGLLPGHIFMLFVLGVVF